MFNKPASGSGVWNQPLKLRLIAIITVLFNIKMS
jgi:hypothetical protein